MKHKSGSDKVVKLGLRHTRPRSNNYGTCVSLSIYGSRDQDRDAIREDSLRHLGVCIYTDKYIYIQWELVIMVE